MSSPTSQPSTSVVNTECKLLGPFAVLVQAALGLLALLSLVFKRWRERPQRPVKIWAFDASKQVFGSALLHLCNLLMSMISSSDLQSKVEAAAAKVAGSPSEDNSWRPNPCSLYLLNIAIDTTLGIPILILILKVLHLGARKAHIFDPPESIRSGYYGEPPRATWWLKQSLLYFIGLLLMKFVVLVILELCPWLIRVGDWALKWTEGNEGLQIAFVLLIFPVIMNAIQYYIVDTFIKKQPDKDPVSEDATTPEEEQSGLLAGHDERGASVDEDGQEVINKSQVEIRSKDTPQLVSNGREYDPARDGEVDTLREEGDRTAGGSTSQQPKERSRER